MQNRNRQINVLTSSLIIDNGGDVRRLRRELKRADNLTESILYYARLRTAEKDVKNREFSAAQAMEEPGT